MLNGSNRIWGKRWVHRKPYSAVVEGGANIFFGPLPYGENGNLIPCAFEKTMVAQAPIGPVHLSLVFEGKVEC